MKKIKLIIFTFSIILLIIIFMFVFQSLSTFGDAESQAKLDYNTIWSDNTDGSISFANCKSVSNSIFQSAVANSLDGCYSNLDKYASPSDRLYYKNNILTFQGGEAVSNNENNILISSAFGSGTNTLKFNNKFDGQDVILILDGGANAEGGCEILPKGNFKCNQINGNVICQETIIKYKAHSLDKGYDVYQDDILIGEFDATNGFNIQISCSVSGGKQTTVGTIKYIGYKARYCDIRDNEVWVQESFSSPVSISDLQYEPMQFCHEARPFTVRQLGEGEKAIEKRKLQSFNRGETLNPSTDQIIVINYAVAVDKCQTDGCKTCGLGESNVLKNGKWVCESFIKEDEPRTITEREIIKPTFLNAFIFTATNENPSFSIGDKRFSSTSQFLCNNLDDGIYRPINPKSECYQSTYNFNGNSNIVKDSEKVLLSSNLQFTHYVGGEYIVRNPSSMNTNEQNSNNLNGNYYFEVNNPLEIEFIKVENNELVFNVKNNLPRNNIFIKVEQHVERTETNLYNKQYNFDIYNSKEIRIPFDTENLGINEVIIKTFYPITINNDEILLYGQGFNFGFENIIKDGEKIIITETKEVIVEKEIIKEVLLKDENWFTKFINWFKEIFWK